MWVLPASAKRSGSPSGSSKTGRGTKKVYKRFKPNLNGHREKRLSNNVHLSVIGVEAEALVLYLDALGYAVGSGSACASSSAGHKASPVLLAIGHGEREALSAVRITVGKGTTRAEVDGFLEAFSTAVSQLRELSPLYTS